MFGILHAIIPQSALESDSIASCQKIASWAIYYVSEVKWDECSGPTFILTSTSYDFSNIWLSK